MFPQIFGGDIVEQIADVDGFVGRDFDPGRLRYLLMGLLLSSKVRRRRLGLCCSLYIFVFVFLLLR
jgi:hypothetical protein